MSLLDVQPVVLITGISAAGKSTVADLLARRFERAAHVKGDVFRRMVVSGRDERYAEGADEAWRQLRLRYRLGAATANRYHESGFAVVVQDVVIGEVLTEYIAAITARPLVVVALTPSLDVVTRREASRAKTAYGRDGEMTALDDALRTETPGVGMWLDNSNQTPEETVDEIIERGLADGAVS